MLKALMLAATAAITLMSSATPVVAQYDPKTGLAIPGWNPNEGADLDRWVDPVIYNIDEWAVVPRGFQDYRQRRYCPAGMRKYGDGSACRWPRPRAGDTNCALYGNPGLSRCFHPKKRYELRSNDHNTLRSHTSRKHERKIRLDRGCPYLVMQNDGNLVLYDCCFKAIWSTCTNKKYKGTGPFRAVMQKDGNFVVYNKKKAIWHTKTCKTKVPGPYRLTVQADHNLVVYGSNDAVVWKSGTHGKGCSKNPTCGVFRCPYGSSKRVDKNPNCIRCRNPWGCTAQECCVGTCNTFQCPPKTHTLIRNPRATKCYHNGNNCNVRTCCDAQPPPPNPLPLTCGNDVAVCPALRLRPLNVKQGISCVPTVQVAGTAPTYTCTVTRDPNRYCHFHACPVDVVPQCELDFRQCPNTNFQVGRDPYNGCQHFPCQGSPIDPTPVAACPNEVQLCPPDSNGVQVRVARNRFLNCDFDACPASNLQQIGGDVVQNQAAQGGGQLSNGLPLNQANTGANAETTKKDVAGFPVIYIVVIALAFVFLMGLIVCIGCQRSSSAEFQRNLHMFGRGSMAGYEMNPGSAYHL